MSLIIDVSINEHLLFMVAAQRVSNTGSAIIDNDLVSDYRITKFEMKNARVVSEQEFGIIQHRYGDGANVLAQKALGAAR